MTTSRTDDTPTTTEARKPQAGEDLRGARTTARDLSAHRRHTWLYDDLLS